MKKLFGFLAIILISFPLSAQDNFKKFLDQLDNSCLEMQALEKNISIHSPETPDPKVEDHKVFRVDCKNQLIIINDKKKLEWTLKKELSYLTKTNPWNPKLREYFTFSKPDPRTELVQLKDEFVEDKDLQSLRIVVSSSGTVKEVEALVIERTILGDSKIRIVATFFNNQFFEASKINYDLSYPIGNRKELIEILAKPVYNKE